MRLYEINAAIDAVLQLAIDGEMSDEDLRTNLDAIEMAFEEKADACACIFKNYLAEATAIKAEEDQLKARRKTAEAQAERMKAYLSAQMQQAGKTKITTARNAISFRKSSPTIIDDASLIPEDYLKITIDEKPDLTAIAAAIKSGTPVPGARIGERQNIQIK